VNNFIEKKVKPVAKLWVAVAGGVLATSSSLIPEPWNSWAVLSVSIATAISVYSVRNVPVKD